MSYPVPVTGLVLCCIKKQHKNVTYGKDTAKLVVKVAPFKQTPVFRGL